MTLPVLLRFSDLLDAAITRPQPELPKAIRDAGYKGRYRGVYPIKVNQQQQVIEEISHFGRKYHYGLEAGSKAELIVALAYMHDPEALHHLQRLQGRGVHRPRPATALKLGLQVFIVIERPGEVHQILERAKRPGRLAAHRRPGQARLARRGHVDRVRRRPQHLRADHLPDLETVDVLKREDMLDCLELLHYHLGSQIPNIRNIRSAMHEACRFYAELRKEGAAMGILDIGGGLAVDYDGSQTNFPSSRNYTLQEFCDDVIDIVMSVHGRRAGPPPDDRHARAGGPPWPTTRSCSSMSSTSASWTTARSLRVLPEGAHETLGRLLETYAAVSKKNIQEVFPRRDVLPRRDRATLFLHGACRCGSGRSSSRSSGTSSRGSARRSSELKHVPEELQGLDAALTSVYYGNFSVFQSLPDLWAIDQLFPIMPIHRLNERPRNQAIISDTTCDCDGKIDALHRPARRGATGSRCTTSRPARTTSSACSSWAPTRRPSATCTTSSATPTS